MNAKAIAHSILAVLFSATALMVGCGDSDDDTGNNGGTGKGGGNYTLDNVCQQIAARQCAAAKPCCESSGIGYDEQGCIATSIADCEAQVALVKAGKRTFHPEAVDACAAVTTDLVGRCAVTIDEFLDFARTSLACQYVFTGNVEEGGACEDDSDCKPPTEANAFAACSEEGKCVIGHIDRGEGQACGEYASCAKGLRCEADPNAGSTTTVCKKPKQAGEACTPSVFNTFECASGLYCHPDSSTCVEAKAIGEACGAPVECVSGNCQEGKCGEPQKLSTVDTEICTGASID